MYKYKLQYFYFILMSLSFLFPVSAYSGVSCEKFAQWVKPMQGSATKDPRGNWRMYSILSDTQAFEAYKFLFEDQNFVPYFGKPFDKLSKLNRKRIYRNMSRARKKCAKWSDEDTKFYMTIGSGRLSIPFNTRMRVQSSIGYINVVDYVRQSRADEKKLVAYQGKDKTDLNSLRQSNKNVLMGRWAIIRISDPGKYNGPFVRSQSDNEFQIDALDSRLIILSNINRHNDRKKSDYKYVVKPEEYGISLSIKGRAASNSLNASLFRLKSLRSINGVDVYKNINSDEYYIRFLQSSRQDEYRFHRMSFNTFCGESIGKIVESSKKEFLALKQLKNAYSIYFDERIVSSLGLFGSDNFESVFGEEFIRFNLQAQKEFIERLRACAIYHPDRQTAAVIATALFGDSSKNLFVRENMLRNIDMAGAKIRLSLKEKLAGKTYHKSISVYMTANKVNQLMSDLQNNRNAFTSELSKLENDNLSNDERLKNKEKIYQQYAFNLPPSEVVPGLIKLGIEFDEYYDRYYEQKRTENEKNRNTYTEGNLVASATRKYVLENCNKAFFAVKSAQKGSGLGSVVTARSIRMRDGQCVIESATHILSFGLKGIKLQSCSGNDVASCSFMTHWTCRYELNPKFGFSRDTVNIDYICPVIRNSPTQMRGSFIRESETNWIANEINW